MIEARLLLEVLGSGDSARFPGTPYLTRARLPLRVPEMHGPRQCDFWG